MSSLADTLAGDPPTRIKHEGRKQPRLNQDQTPAISLASRHWPQHMRLTV